MKGQALLIMAVVVAALIIAFAIAQGNVNYTTINNTINNSAGISVIWGNVTAYPGVPVLEWANVSYPGATLPYANVTGVGLSAIPWANITYPGVTLPYNNLTDPTASKTISFGAFSTVWSFSTPSTGFDINGIGAFSDDLLHVHQHTGNPGVTDLVHFEATDVDVTVLNLTGVKQPVLDVTGSITARGGNVTATDRLCLNLACTKYIWANSTHINITNVS